MSMTEEQDKKRAQAARYNASEKGRARHRRYNQSEKGLARYTRYYELNAFELNFDRYMRRLRQRIAERSELLYGLDAKEVRARLDGQASSRGTPTERRKRNEELQRLIDSRRTPEELEREAKRRAELRTSLQFR